MKSGISRKKLWRGLALVLLGTLMIVLAIFASNLWLLYAGIALMVAVAVLDRKHNCCPHCGRYAVIRNWPWDYNAGICRKCGRTVQWSD